MISMHMKKNYAQKYAQAFFNSFPQELTNQSFSEEIKRLLVWKQEHTLFFRLLQISNISLDEKKTMIEKLVSQVKLNNSVHALLKTILKQKDISNIEFILSALLYEKNKRNNIHEIYITSSGELEENQKIAISEKLNNLLPGELIFHFSCDESLISGIKIQSERYYWEESIARKIRALKRVVSQAVI